jgi:signal transduction histidine kinase/DNA-binding response OmpR family regulator
MTRHCITFFYFLSVTQTIAQIQVADSLKTTLDSHPEKDSVRVNLLNELSYQYQWIDFNRSLQHAEEAMKIGESISYQAGIATACFRQAHCYWSLGNSELAIEKALRAVNIATQEDLTNILAETYRLLAMSYRDQQEVGKAIFYIKLAESLAIEKKNWDLLARVYNMAGIIACTRELDDSALIYYNKALHVSRQHATTQFHISQVLSNIGELYLKDNPDKSLDYFTRALASAKETQNRSAEAGITADIGRAYLQKKQYTNAGKYLQHSLKLSRELGLKRVIRHAYLALVDLKVKEHKTTEAFSYMKAYYDVRDSLMNVTKTRQIVELETHFETEKKEQKIKLLEQEQHIQLLWRNVLIVGSLLMLTALIIIYRLQGLRSEKAKQLLETQQALNEKLKETDTIKSKFFANISHEFRTPLSLIMGPVEEQLRESSIGTAQRKGLTLIQRNANRLLALVNQLLDLSKLEAGKMELSVRSGNLSKFLRLLTASFDSLAEHRQIRFVKDIPVMEHVVGYDADKIEKITSNILFNAFKFTPSGGQVTVEMKLLDDEQNFSITVSDTGKGIPKHEQANIFSPFYQLKNDSEEGQPGTGLGLSLVHEVVRLYGGSINLISEINQGTNIVVTLPIFKTAETIDDSLIPIRYPIREKNILVPYESPHSLEIELTDTPSILIIEDNVDLKQFISSGFNRTYTVMTAADGAEGLAMSFQYIPDIIISDVMMPGLDGLELTKCIKEDERTSHIPIILLTARVDEISRIEGWRKGADDYLAKPFSLEELRMRVFNLCEQRKRLAAKFKEEVTKQYVLTEPREPSLDEKFVAKVKAIIEVNISNSLFGVEMLAAEMNISRAQLFRKLKALMNISPSDFINDYRLQRAAKLIRARADNVAQIGYAVGFNEQSYFAKRFRKKYGMSPSEYAQ